MAVTSVSVYTLPDTAIVYDTNLRPTMTIKLAGGTGPYDVTWEWDTSSGFASGNLVQAFDTGLTGNGPHSKAPGSDLGGAQIWYFRVLVTDTNDSNVYTHPPSGTHTLDYEDVDLTASFLHQQSNVGVGFTTDGADGAPEDKPRHLYQYGNVGVGFGPDLPDGDPKDNPSFLYNYNYLEPTQPCPWIDYITPTLAKQGTAIAIFGDSFGATQLTWGGEVRLYETQDLDGTYSVMSPTFWSDQELSVVVPVAGASGWVAVVHTTGTPTCDGSEMKYLQVEIQGANADAGWWLKTANPENQLNDAYTVFPRDVVKTSFRKIMNGIGSGRMELPLGDPSIQEIIDPVMRKGTLVRTYLDSLNRYTWFAESLTYDYNEEGDAIAVISGRGMEAVAAWTSVPPNDFPISPSLSPTWIYGSTDNFVSNPGFDDIDDSPVLANSGGEDGNDDDGNAEGWSVRGDDLVTRKAVKDDSNARTDDWYIEVEASDNHSGIQQSVTCVPNKVYHVRAYVKDPLASGMRITLAVGGADDIEALNTTYTNNFKYENEILAELDNVARNAAHNGLPGGSTDGSWQVLDVEVKTGDEQTSLSLAIMNDHHGTGIFNPFWVDDVSCVGWGLGLDPWTAFRPDEHASSSFRISHNIAFDGSNSSCEFNPLEKYAGVQQVIAVNPSTKYTATIWAWTSLLNVDDTYKLVIRANDGTNDYGGTQLAVQDAAPDTGTWTQYQVVFETDPDTEEVIFRFAYTGENNPGPIYVDSASLVPGEPAATAGEILNNVLDKLDEQDKLLYVDRTFTSTVDSKGHLWVNPLSMDIEPTESIYGLLSRLVALGHEWEIVPVDFAEGGDSGFALNVYVARAYEPSGGLGLNLAKEDDGPVIMPGDATIGGRFLKSGFNVDSVLAIGDNGKWSRVYQHPWLTDDIQAWDDAPLGYLESFGHVEETISVSASDETTISQFAEARLAEEKDKERAIQLQMQRSSVLRPFLHFNVGDTLFVDMPPTDPDPPISDGSGGTTRSYPKRVRSLQADLSGEGSEITFQVDISRVIYEDELAWYAMIAQLSERSPAGTTGSGTGVVTGSGGVVSVVSGGGATAPTSVAKHSHSLKSTDITDKALSGDVSGSLPGPVTVNALKGRPVSRDIPTPVTALDVVMVFDPDTKIWTPSNADITTPVIIQSVPFSEPGALVNGSGTFRLYAPVARTILDVQAQVGVAPSGGVVTVDVNKDGTTIFTTQANRPEIASGEYVSDLETPDVTAWAADSYLSVDVDAHNDCEDLTVVVRWTDD